MENKLTSLQFSAIYYFIILSCYSGISSYSLFHIAYQDSWISIILGSILGIIPLLIFYFIFNYEKDLSIFEKNDKLFGKYLGGIINFIIGLSVLFLVTICSFNLAVFINLEFLDKTPIIVISILIFIPVIYILSKGLNVLGRTTIILFFISIVLLILTILGLLLEFDIENIKPILDNNNILKGSIRYISYNILPLFLLMFIPANDVCDKGNLSKSLIIFYVASNVVILVSCFLVIGVLGIDMASMFQYPEYDLLTRVSLAGFIDRVESFLSIRWIFYLFIIISIGFKYIENYIKISFKVNNKFVIYFIVFVCILISNFIFKNNVVYNLFFRDYLYLILLFCFLFIPFIIFIKIIAKKK